MSRVAIEDFRHGTLYAGPVGEWAPVTDAGIHNLAARVGFSFIAATDANAQGNAYPSVA